MKKILDDTPSLPFKFKCVGGYLCEEIDADTFTLLDVSPSFIDGILNGRIASFDEEGDTATCRTVILRILREAPAHWIRLTANLVERRVLQQINDLLQCKSDLASLSINEASILNSFAIADSQEWRHSQLAGLCLSLALELIKCGEGISQRLRKASFLVAIAVDKSRRQPEYWLKLASGFESEVLPGLLGRVLRDRPTSLVETLRSLLVMLPSSEHDKLARCVNLLHVEIFENVSLTHRQAITTLFEKPPSSTTSMAPMVLIDEGQSKIDTRIPTGSSVVQKAIENKPKFSLSSYAAALAQEAFMLDESEDEVLARLASLIDTEDYVADDEVVNCRIAQARFVQLVARERIDSIQLPDPINVCLNYLQKHEDINSLAKKAARKIREFNYERTLFRFGTSEYHQQRLIFSLAQQALENAGLDTKEEFSEWGASDRKADLSISVAVRSKRPPRTLYDFKGLAVFARKSDVLAAIRILSASYPEVSELEELTQANSRLLGDRKTLKLRALVAEELGFTKVRRPGLDFVSESIVNIIGGRTPTQSSYTNSATYFYHFLTGVERVYCGGAVYSQLIRDWWGHENVGNVIEILNDADLKEGLSLRREINTPYYLFNHLSFGGHLRSTKASGVGGVRSSLFDLCLGIGATLSKVSHDNLEKKDIILSHALMKTLGYPHSNTPMPWACPSKIGAVESMIVHADDYKVPSSY